VDSDEVRATRMSDSRIMSNTWRIEFVDSDDRNRAM